MAGAPERKSARIPAAPTVNERFMFLMTLKKCNRGSSKSRSPASRQWRGGACAIAWPEQISVHGSCREAILDALLKKGVHAEEEFSAAQADVRRI